MFWVLLKACFLHPPLPKVFPANHAVRSNIHGGGALWLSIVHPAVFSPEVLGFRNEPLNAVPR